MYVYILDKSSKIKFQICHITQQRPCEIPPWNSMGFHGILWKSKEIHGNPWNSMELPWSIHGVPWSIHGMPWSYTELHDALMEVNGMPWGFLKYRLSSMECHNVSMEFDRIPYSLYEKIHRNSVTSNSSTC